MSEIVLNYGQNVVVDAGVNHILKGNLMPFEFSGRAGTGKSVVLKEIQKRSGIPISKVAPMAYIGQAAIVMRLKGFPNARTAHSWLYNPEIEQMKDKMNNNVIYNEYLSSPEMGLVFNPKPMYNIELLMIDEGGTLPLSMRPDIEAHGIPTIVSGDIRQLPPVADKPAYLNGTNKILELTEVMRQNQDSSILYLAERALFDLPLHHGFYGDSMVIYEDELTDDMIRGANILLCGTNNTRERLNNLVRREILGFSSDMPNYGEKVICRKNDWTMDVNGIGLGNGLIGSVTNQPDVSDFNGDVFFIDFKPDLFDGTFFRIDVDYPYFISPCNMKKELKNRKFQSGHKFDFAYAITVHLSQGGQYPYVIYFEENVNRTIQNRINYTAITRASKGLIYVKKRKRFFFS